MTQLGNQAFASAISKWAFHERGVLRASHMQHHPLGSAQQPEIYRINEEVVLSVEIQELANGEWRPYR